MAATSPASIATPCAFFDKVPPELRNTIYEFSFANDNEEDAEINLFEAKPPSSALLLTCKQANQEAKGIHRDAFRKYWTKSNFVVKQACETPLDSDLDESAGSELAAALSGFCDSDLDNVRRFRVKWLLGSRVIFQKELVDPRGGWISHSSRGILYLAAFSDPDAFDGHYYQVCKDLERTRQELSEEEEKVSRRAQLVRMIGPRGMSYYG